MPSTQQLDGSRLQYKLCTVFMLIEGQETKITLWNTQLEKVGSKRSRRWDFTRDREQKGYVCCLI